MRRMPLRGMVRHVAVRAVALTVLLAIVALAGCVDGEETPEAAAPTSVDPGPEDGVIEGQVVDSEQLPVAGASVAIPDEGLETTTDEEGVFVFEQVAPGTKTVFVQKLGFDSLGKTVHVQAGQTAQVTITLDALRVVDPWAETFIGDGFMTCQWSTPVIKSRIACNAIGDEETSRFTFAVQPGLRETLTETIWEQTSALSPEYIELDHIFDDDCKECNVVKKSPHVHKSTDYDDDFDEEKEILESYWLPFGNTTQPVIFAFQQKFTVYTSAFYHQPVPAGFSAAPE